MQYHASTSYIWVTFWWQKNVILFSQCQGPHDEKVKPLMATSIDFIVFKHQDLQMCVNIII